MRDNEREFYFAKSISDLLYQLKSIAGLEVAGGCTRLSPASKKIISIRKIPELAEITKHERYLDAGPAVTLSTLLSVAKKRIPLAFLDAVESVGNPFLKNLATLGGSMCAGPIRSTLYAPLIALDTKVEIKSQTTSRFVPLLNFETLPRDFIISNIRIPLNDWDISIFKRLGPANTLSDKSASFVFLCNVAKDTITNIKIAFAGVISFRASELENRLLGAHVPFLQKDMDARLLLAKKQFEKSSEGFSVNEILKIQFLNLMQMSFEQLM